MTDTHVKVQYNIHRAVANAELAQLRLTDGIRLIRRTSTDLFLGDCSKVEVLTNQDSNVSKRLFIKTPEIAAT